jgi:prepilin-type N-terminal cleavage/methylation domain-containing protein
MQTTRVRHTQCAGYSLVEVLIVLSIITITGTVALTQYRALQKSGDTHHAAVVYANALREAQNRAMTQDNNSAWGATIVGGNVVIFSGTSYATRTTSRDLTYWLPTSVTATGTTATLFTKTTGLPDAAATTTFTTTYETSVTTVSAGGAVGYTL